jgi:hypothetical protein
MNQIKDNNDNGKIDSAQMLLLSRNSPVSRLIAKEFTRIGRPLG